MNNTKRNCMKGLIVLLSAGLFMLAAVLIINVHVRASTEGRILAPGEAASVDADCILVLGAGVREGGKASPMLEDRLVQGIELYNGGLSNRLLMSGDHGRKGYDEVNVMKQFAMDRGIASEHIFMDHAGFSTYESLYRAGEIFKAGKIIIVTQKYHLYRALYIAGKLGLEAYGVPSDPRRYAGQELRDLREAAARVKDYFTVMIKPEPTFLGETIPINGSGDLTND